MRTKRCSNGHFYDEDKHSACPYCQTVSVFSTEIGEPTQALGYPDFTTPMGIATPSTDGVTVPVWNPPSNESGKISPSVGWLICIAGENLGRDFRLTAGRNTIGRSPSNSVALARDESVSRDIQAMIVYDPKSNIFHATPGKTKGLCYINGNLLLEQSRIKKGDILELGDCRLLFIPCCDDSFSWNDIFEK